MRQGLKTGLITLIAMAVAYLLLWPVPFDPVAWEPSPDPGMTGAFAANHALAGVEHLAPGIGVVGAGPEDVTRAPDDFFYTGLHNGRIVRFRADGDAGPEILLTTGGRPLGMQFDAQGNLIVADAFRGLLSVAPDGGVSVLADSIDGKRMIFVDDLDIASDGVIWFSDASQRFDLNDNHLDFWESRATGRLLTYDPATGETRVRLESLMFANGVALGPDEEYVLVNETMGYRIARLWLKGPKAGQSEIFLDGLPAYPDNISYNGAGVFWVALNTPRAKGSDRLAPWPFLRKALWRLPESIATLGPGPLYGMIIGVDVDGNVVHNLQDPSGAYGSITSVNEIEGYLYLGSIIMTSVGRIAAP